jgi:serine/threonine protein kinase
MLTDDERHPVDKLAEEFADRIRAGESPQIEEYCRTHPEHADMIRSVFPSIQMVEKASQREEQHRRSGGSSSVSVRPMPQALGDFQLIREIGRGGMGVVYEAEQKSLKRHVALKVISSLIAGSKKQLMRFRREAESAASLHHSNIVPIYGSGEDHGLPFYAMQLIDGVTLAAVINRLRVTPRDAQVTEDRMAAIESRETPESAAQSGARRFGVVDAVLQLLGTATQSDAVPWNQSQLSADLSETRDSPDPWSATRRRSQTPIIEMSPETASNGSSDEVLCPAEDVHLSPAWFRNVARLMANVANAVDYAHRQGILHRDLKPANLILDRDGTIWVADFGLARQENPDDVTQTGEIVGTLRYMAPEQLQGRSDVRTDIYALGLTLYELLVLKPAWSAPQLLSGQSRPPIPRLRSLRPEIPRDLETITLKACLAEPERRYQSAREFEADLRRFLEDRPILARRVTPIERLWRWSKRNPLIASLSTATLLLLVVIAIILGISNRRIQSALEARNLQYQRAEQNLAERTQALASAERERVRAETNLELAISAFEEVFNNISARGRSESLLEELSDDELLPAADAVLSSADVTLLETLLEFFDRLAAENSKDLSIESAAARRRVGDIQQQLGRLENAQQSYQRALDAYKAIVVRRPDDVSLILAEAEILHQMMVTAAKQGEVQTALRMFRDLRSVLAGSTAVNDSTNGRLVLATAINSLVSFGLRMTGEQRYRLRNPAFNRMLPADEPPSPAQNQRLRRDAELNGEAITILQKLISEEPSSVAYRLALSQATRDKARIAQLFRDWNQADEAMAAAIGILENLQKEFPSSDRFKYELAETLSTMPSIRPADLQRLMRSQQLCRELMEAHPTIPEYRGLYAATLTRIARIQIAQGKTERAEITLKETLKHHQWLADQFPDVFMHQLSLIRTLQQLAQVYGDEKRTDLAKNLLDIAITRLEDVASRGRLRNNAELLLSRIRESRSKLGD